jgi:predicted transcriptional regulator of viral defense system
MNSSLLKKIKKSPFDAEYARSKGVSKRMLSYYVNAGVLVRLAHGIYALPDKLSFDFEDILREKLSQAPQAIVGLRTALKLYDLTDEAPANIDLMVPKSNIPKKKMDDVKLHSVIDHLFNEGITKIRGIPVTTIERTIVEILRKNGTPKEGRTIIQEAQKKGLRINFSKLEHYATIFRVKLKFESIMVNL